MKDQDLLDIFEFGEEIWKHHYGIAIRIPKRTVERRELDHMKKCGYKLDYIDVQGVQGIVLVFKRAKK